MFFVFSHGGDGHKEGTTGVEDLAIQFAVDADKFASIMPANPVWVEMGIHPDDIRMVAHDTETGCESVVTE